MKTSMDHMGPKGTIRGQRPPLGECRWSIQDKMGSYGIIWGWSFIFFSNILWSFILCHPHVFLHNSFVFNSKSKILDIFQQRTKWAYRKHMVFLTRVLKKDEKLQETKWAQFLRHPVARLPAIQSIQAKHWRSMVGQDPYLSEVFVQPPLIAYRRQRNIRDHLIRAKLPSDPKLYPERRQRGMKKCGKSCTACPYIREVKSLKVNGNEWNFR